MAITWGSYVNNSTGNGMRLGYEFSQSPSSVGSGTSSVTVTLKIYFESKRSVSDSTNSYSVTGNFSGSGSGNINHGSSGGTTLIRTLTRTVSTSYSGTVKSSFSASISGINAISGTASVSGSWTTGQRPISAPAAPSSVAVSRSSDTSHTITWTNNSPTNAAAPYKNVEVQRWDNVGNAWATIATLGVVTSYTNTSTRADRQYRWRVRSTNSAGSSSYAYSGYWSTTPAAPGTPKATKSANDVILTWTNTATKGDGVEIWHASNGVWEGSRMALLSGQPTTWTHTNPDPTKTHTYKLKAVAGQNDDAPNTYSAFSGASNVIQLLTNPAAPTKLSPASGTVDAATGSVTLTWQHNEVDGTAQTKYDLQYRLNGGSWTTVSATTGTQSHTFAAGTLPNGSVMDWQVRTYGQYSTAPAYSPWSAAATLKLSATPGAGVVFPDDVTPVDTSRVTVQWSYYDEEGTAQAQYKVRLFSAGGASVLETRAGVGNATSVPLSTLLKDGASYHVGVSVQDGSGLWSPETTQDFTVAYALPDVPTLDLSWDEGRAAVVASIGNPTGGTGADVDHNELWRSVDWETYELVEDNIPPNGTVTDHIPALGTENVYRVVAVTAIEAAAESEPVVYETPGTAGWFIINGGQGLAERVRVRYNPTLSRSFSRDKTLHKFAGRRFPVETAGEHRNRTYDLGVSVLGDDDATLAALEHVADLPSPLVLRTPLKDRMFASLDGVSSTRAIGYENVTMKLTQLDPPNIGTMPFDPVVYRTNGVPNPSFEDGAGTWTTVSGTLTSQPIGNVLNALGQVGTAEGRLVSSGAAFTYAQATTPIDVTPGQFIAMAGLAGSAVGSQVTLGVRFLDESLALVSAAWATSTTTAGRLSVAAVVPATAIYAFPAIRVYAPNGAAPTAGDEGTFDNLITGTSTVSTAEALAAVADYFDGDTWEGDAVLTARWTGDPNASPSQLTRGGLNT
ncbi:minor tail protein [Arthrobacter phage BaileyBlu]|uniref:Minor tail protein n=1 Tax=Arthrobacter phage BaileyBlu TaxID=2910754 RepID=A0AA49BQ47_9CAUD|nr:virion structural protein [Arthrobacter phage BaileyBlu]UJQ87154.1 minor tail protein [Arthrobacter phage BaileyBlu]